MSFIEKYNIFLENDFSSKDELFDFISNKSKELNISSSVSEVKEGLYDREKDGNTVIADMIAMPHARIESINDLKVILISLKKPILYNEEESIDLAYSILAPIDANDEFIDILMLVAIIVQDGELQNVIRNSKAGEEEKISNMIDEALKIYNQI
ncbi:PTS sugar transporter subunit IIA [Brachyspira hampsonii]|nr:PTS sugar transporter subunit IIA [Brachyspira hampsonii]